MTIETLVEIFYSGTIVMFNTDDYIQTFDRRHRSRIIFIPLSNLPKANFISSYPNHQIMASWQSLTLSGSMIQDIIAQKVKSLYAIKWGKTTVSALGDVDTFELFVE